MTPTTDPVPLPCRGRFKPLASLSVDADGRATIRVDFAGEPAVWAEIDLPDGLFQVAEQTPGG